MGYKKHYRLSKAPSDYKRYLNPYVFISVGVFLFIIWALTANQKPFNNKDSINKNHSVLKDKQQKNPSFDKTTSKNKKEQNKITIKKQNNLTSQQQNKTINLPTGFPKPIVIEKQDKINDNKADELISQAEDIILKSDKLIDEIDMPKFVPDAQQQTLTTDEQLLQEKLKKIKERLGELQ
jgi:uncharacterized membrane protein YfhO